MKITSKLESKIRNSPAVYLVGCWARWGIQKYHWTGKWYIDKETGIPEPIVYFYNDHNGEYEEYQKLPISRVTTGFVVDWTFYKPCAERLAEKMNEINSR